MSPALRVEIRRMRWAGGMTYAAISAAAGVCEPIARAACADLPGLCRGRRHDGRATMAHRARRRASLARSNAVFLRARTMRLERRSLAEIADDLGVCRKRVARLTRDLGIERCRSARRDGVEVPMWARRAGLADDYRDVTRLSGEHAAAAHCRRLKAEAPRPTHAEA